MTHKTTTIIAEPSKQELFITREFNAPRELVYRALIEPELLMQWLGPREMAMNIDSNEIKPGGFWRFTHTSPKGMVHGFHSAIHEATFPERIIRTFEYEGLPERGHVSLETATFEALDGERTRLVIHSVFRSVADRDGMILSGMERGVNDSHERMDELFGKLASRFNK